jgi:hypothetical protein
MSKVAIPIHDNVLSRNFGTDSHYAIYEIVKKRIVGKYFEIPEAQDKTELTQWIENLGVTDLIVNRIDRDSLLYLGTTKINLFVGVAINQPEILIMEYMNGTLRSDAFNVFSTNSNE